MYYFLKCVECCHVQFFETVFYSFFFLKKNCRIVHEILDYGHWTNYYFLRESKNVSSKNIYENTYSVYLHEFHKVYNIFNWNNLMEEKTQPISFILFERRSYPFYRYFSHWEIYKCISLVCLFVCLFSGHLHIATNHNLFGGKNCLTLHIGCCFSVCSKFMHKYILLSEKIKNNNNSSSDCASVYVCVVKCYCRL